MTKRPTVEFDGKTYSLRSAKVEIPDFSLMSRTTALVWLNANTVPRGYSRSAKPNLAGLNLVVR